MRVFVAIELSSEVRSRIESLASELGPRVKGARFVAPRNLHLTLRFLGEVTSGVVESLARDVRPRIARLPRFSLDFFGCGVFPDSKRPRVLWVGVREPPEALFRLQSEVEAAARREGFEPETRPFEPHLTVARFRRPQRGLDTLLSPARDRDFGKTNVSRAVVFESELSSNGSTYRALESLGLGGGGGSGGPVLGEAAGDGGLPGQGLV